MTNLALSLLNAVHSPLTVNRAFRNTVPKDDNPRIVPDAPDRAKYFVSSSGEPLTIRIPALLDREMQETKLKDYFDVWNQSVTLYRFFPLRTLFLTIKFPKIDDNIFRKMRAVFGLRNIPGDDPSYPKAVVMAGARAALYLYQLQGRLEMTFEGSETGSDGQFQKTCRSGSGAALCKLVAANIPF